MKSYTELCQLATFEERLKYLELHGEVGKDTFGFDRWLNQAFYQSKEWRQFRDRIIVRDNGCDLGCEDHPITDWVLQGGKSDPAEDLDSSSEPHYKRRCPPAQQKPAGPGERHLCFGGDA